MGEIRLNNAQWEFISKYIREQDMGRPRSRDKECFEAILYVLKTGCQWALLPSCYPPKSTVHRRYKLWKKQGLFRTLFRRTRTKEPQTFLTHMDATIKIAKREQQNFESGKIQDHQNNSHLQQQSNTVLVG